MTRPTLTMYHPNGKGTGSAIRLELHPAHDDTAGSIMATIATQLTTGNCMGSMPVYPRFDWDGAITVKLDFTDISKMLQVFRGEYESIEDGRGLFHKSTRGTTKIVLAHSVEPINGYMLEVYRKTSDSEDSNARIFLSPYEALGLTAAIESSMGVICFGIPMVIPNV